MDATISIPRLRPILRHALPTVIECNLVPVGLFVVVHHAVGPMAAVVAAWTWVTVAVVRRWGAARCLPGVLVLSTVGLTIRSIVALATGSLVVYFVQPAAGTALVAVAFFISVPLGRPLAERLAHDICPFDTETRNHPALRAFLANVSVLWGVASTINVLATLWLLATQPVATFVIAKATLGPIITITFGALATAWFRASMARQGIEVRWAHAG